MSRKSREKTLRQSKVMAKVLQREKPQVFNYEHPAPLAIGVHNQIQEHFPKAGKHVVWAFLHWWTTRRRYVAQLTREGAVRLNLDGTVCEPVSDSHRQHAEEHLEQIEQKLARRKAE